MSSEELKDLQKSQMEHDYICGLTQREISEKYGVHLNTVARYAKAGEWKAKRAEIAEAVTADVEPVDVLEKQSIEATLRVLHKIVKDYEKGLFTGKLPENLQRHNLKSIADSLEKIIKLKMHVESGGVERKHVVSDKRTQILDWNKLIELSVKEKKENPNFDEKKFIKTVIDNKE